MKPQALNLRIGRLVIDADIAEGVTAVALAQAIQSELASRTMPRSARPHSATAHSWSAAPLARAIAGRVADNLGAMNVEIGAKATGGGDNGS
jgi:hypothetical protein